MDRAIGLQHKSSSEVETTFDFRRPATWPSGSDDAEFRSAALAALEEAINDEVFRIYGICGQDRGLSRPNRPREVRFKLKLTTMLNRSIMTLSASNSPTTTRLTEDLWRCWIATPSASC